MSNNISSVSQQQLQDLGLSAPADPNAKKTDSQTDFLQLFVAQLKNQNPLEPQDGAQFLGQLAQFSTVEGINNMESSFSNLANALQSNQALQASNLVGRQVAVPTHLGILQSGAGMKGLIDVPSSVTDLKLQVVDSTGQVVKNLAIGSAEEGTATFNWNGLDDNGSAVPAGLYRIQAMASVGGQNQALNTYVNANVDSVSMGSQGNGVTLNVSGYGPINLNDIKTIS